MKTRNFLLIAFQASLVVPLLAGDPVNYGKQPVYNESSVVGEIGFTTGFNGTRENLNGNNNLEPANIFYGTVNGAVAYRVRDQFIFAYDAIARYDDYANTEDFSDGEDPRSEFNLGAHFLTDFGDSSRIGVMMSYGLANPQDGDNTDAYDVALTGLEYQKFYGENILFFSQGGYGFKPGSGQDNEEAFDGGPFVRIGATYFVGEKTAITLDFEAAYTPNYIDGNDEGYFYGVTLGGETALSDKLPIYGTYYTRYNYIDSTTEGELVEEFQFGIGLKYVFGAGSAREAAKKGRSIGTPYMPLRASAWTENID